jgi:hypothetical protein
VSGYDEVNARYLAASAELERLTAVSAAAPDDATAAEAAQRAYETAQAVYAELLVAIDAANAAAPVVEAAPTADPVVPTIAPAPDAAPAAIAPSPGGYDLGPVSTAPAVRPPSAADAGAATAPHPRFGTPSGEMPAGIVLQRAPGSIRFLPPSDEGVVVERSPLAQRKRPASSELSRQRNIAGDLPEWSPRPPGEGVALTGRR